MKSVKDKQQELFVWQRCSGTGHNLRTCQHTIKKSPLIFPHLLIHPNLRKNPFERKKMISQFHNFIYNNNTIQYIFIHSHTMFTVSRFPNLSILQKSSHHQNPQKKTYPSDFTTQNIYF